MNINVSEIKTYLKISWRNIIRNKRRTTLTSLSIIFGSTGLILFGGFVEGSYDGLREVTIHSRLGHIQLTKKGYREKGGLHPHKYSIANYKELKEEIAKIPGVELITKRVEFNGLLATDESSVTFVAKGVDADIDRKINTFVEMKKGRPTRDDKPYDITIGVGLAQKLDIKVGDNVTLMSNYGNAGLNAIDVYVRGIFKSGVPDYDNTMITVPIKSSWELLSVEHVHIVVIMLKETSLTESVMKRLQALIHEKKYDLEIKSWHELATFYQKVRTLYGSLFGFITIVVIIIVIFTIANTITMSIYERIREIGSIRAIGTNRKGVVIMFLFEGMYIGLIGGILGVVLGVVFSIIITKMHVMMPPPPGLSMEYPLRIFIVPTILMQTYLMSIVTSIVAAIGPARKAARLSIVEAIRHV